MSIIQTIYGYNSHNVLNKTDFDINLVGSDGYGETGYESIENLVKQYSDYFNDKTVFYDLGSSNERYKTSLGLMDKYNITNQNISFINDNILNCDISDATVIYTDNTLFPNNIDSEIYNMIPTDCLVISRKSFKQSWVNKELFKDGFTSSTNYGTNTIYTFLKKI